jgi:hypothetical protein
LRVIGVIKSLGFAISASSASSSSSVSSVSSSSSVSSASSSSPSSSGPVSITSSEIGDFESGGGFSGSGYFDCFLNADGDVSPVPFFFFQRIHQT